MLIFENYFWLIYLASFFASIISASIGFVGGTVSFVVMAQFLAMEVLIPLHGAIQFFSNAWRAQILRHNINLKIGRESVIGAVFGAFVGYFYLTPLPQNYFNLVIGLFTIFITLAPKFRLNFNFAAKWPLLGFLACSLGLYVGAVGTFVGAVLLAQNLEKKEMVATQAALQSVIHFAKIIVFALLGFSLAPWLWLILGTIFCAYLGTKIGTKILDKIPQAMFRKIVTAIILILAARLVFVGIFG